MIRIVVHPLDEVGGVQLGIPQALGPWVEGRAVELEQHSRVRIGAVAAVPGRRHDDLTN
ncbi:hypothetical protein ACF3NS_05450 [Arsenicicoccus cauae]|uniref:hypothetical protein n=1 Tax=Arsenicicoccus cauae TaxID=2663847 RepID=UPI00370DE0AA